MNSFLLVSYSSYTFGILYVINQIKLMAKNDKIQHVTSSQYSWKIFYTIQLKKHYGMQGLQFEPAIDKNCATIFSAVGSSTYAGPIDSGARITLT